MVDGIDRPKVQYFVSWLTSQSNNTMNSAVRAVGITHIFWSQGCIFCAPWEVCTDRMARNNIYWCVANYSLGNVERIISADPIWTIVELLKFLIIQLWSKLDLHGSSFSQCKEKLFLKFILLQLQLYMCAVRQKVLTITLF